MSRNFEEEYRQMIDSELPDLWDRIEAQLPNAAAAVLQETESGERPASFYAVETAKNEDDVTAGSRRRFPDRWMPAVIAGAAAVLVILAALPVLFLPRGGDKNGAAGGGFSGGAMDMAESAEGYFAADDGCDETIREETAAAPMDAGVQSESESADYMAVGESAREDDIQQDAALAPEENGLQTGGTEPVSEAKADLCLMEIEVLDCIQGEDGGVFYEASVLEDRGNDSEKGTRVYFRTAKDGEEQGGSAEAFFRRGEQYTLSLYRSGETIEDYGIKTGDEDLYAGEMYIVYDVILKQ